jgi:hypothetical protein
MRYVRAACSAVRNDASVFASSLHATIVPPDVNVIVDPEIA